MKASQIIKTLSEIGNYSCNVDIPLKELSYIYLNTDGCLYPGDDTRFNFRLVDDGGVLLVYKGHTDRYGNFIKSSDKPAAFIDFAVISGFKLSPSYSPKVKVTMNGRNYESVADALLDAEDGDKLVLADNVYFDSQLKIKKNITIDLNNHILSTNNSTTEYNFIVGGDIKIENGIIDVNGVFGVGVQKTAKLTLTNTTVRSLTKTNDYLIGSWGTTVINSGSFSGIYNTVNAFAGSLYINDGEFNTRTTDFSGEYKSEDILAGADSKVYIKGGSFSKEINSRFIASGYHSKERDGRYIVEEHNYVSSYYQTVDGILSLIGECSCGNKKILDTVDPNETVYVSNANDLKNVLLAGNSVILENNIDIKSVIELSGSSTNVSVDLNGHILRSTRDEVYDGIICEVFLVKNGATLNLKGNGDVKAYLDPEKCKDLESCYIETISAIDGATVNIQDGRYTSNGCTTIYATRKATVNIYGGKYEATETYDNMLFTLDINEKESQRGTINVYGGSFVNFNPADHKNDGIYTNKVMPGYYSSKEGNIYVVKKLAATVNGENYNSLNDAIKNASSGSAINIESDIIEPTAINITKKLEINLNSHKLSIPNDTAGDGVFHLMHGGELIINGDGEINGVGNNAWNMAIYVEGGDLTINGGTYTNVGASGDTSGHYDLIYVKGGKLTINGGTFIAETPKWTINKNDSVPSEVIIYGGTFYNYDPSFSESENPAENFVAEGYKSTADRHGNFVVSKA